MIDQGSKDELLNCFPEQKHQLLNIQIEQITKIIQDHKLRYTYSEDFKNAINIVVESILNGNFLGD